MGSALVSQLQAMLLAGVRVAGKQVRGKGPGVLVQWLNMSQLCPGGLHGYTEGQWNPACGQQDQGSHCPPGLGTDEATP